MERELNIGIKIKEYMKIAGIKKRAELCRRTGLPDSTIRDILNGKNKNPRIDTLYKIVEGLGITLTDFLEEHNQIEDKYIKYRIDIINKELKNLSKESLDILINIIKELNQKK